MWKADVQPYSESIYHYRLLHSGVVLSFAEVVDLWINDTAFCEYFISVLRESPYSCYRFETPALTLDLLGRPFEFVLVDSPAIDIEPNYLDFAGYFKTAPAASVVQFANLGHDALLVVSTPPPETSNYSHIAAFTRNAPLLVQCALWHQVGCTMKQRLGDKPVWLNTAGGGVPWLHIRLDDRPKYYRHSAYKHYP